MQKTVVILFLDGDLRGWTLSHYHYWVRFLATVAAAGEGERLSEYGFASESIDRSIGRSSVAIFLSIETDVVSGSTAPRST